MPTTLAQLREKAETLQEAANIAYEEYLDALWKADQGEDSDGDED